MTADSELFLERSGDLFGFPEHVPVPSEDAAMPGFILAFSESNRENEGDAGECTSWEQEEPGKSSKPSLKQRND